MMSTSQYSENRTTISSFQVNNLLIFRNVNEARIQLPTTEPNDGKIVHPFQIGNAQIHNEFESQEAILLTRAKLQENAGGPPIKEKNSLPSDFVPDEYDVICSRGKEARNHKGNLLFQSVIKKTAPKYASVEGKLSKSIIVSQIVEAFQKRSSTGRGFVKLIGTRWYELGELSAREKVSQSLRDVLHGQYKSSSKSKRRRKNEMNFRMMQDLEAMVDSNEFISSRTRAMEETIKKFGDGLSDGQVLLLMTKMNCEILEQLKGDQGRPLALETI